MTELVIPSKTLENGFSLPVYGVGLWGVGGTMQADTSRDDIELAALRSALDMGVTHFDTAQMYGNGHSEELLGQAIQGYDRNKLQIATKIIETNMAYDDLLSSFDVSLARLKTDYVDLLILHRYPPAGVNIADTMKALDLLVSQGIVKHIGVSNFTPERLTEAQGLTDNKIVCNQVHYNTQYREVEARGVLAQCQNEDVMLVAWRPLQKGALLQTQLLQEFAQKYNKTPAQVALNWLISQDKVVTIAKTSSIAHLQENLGAFGWDIEPEDVERIRLEFPDQKQVSDAVPLDY